MNGPASSTSHDQHKPWIEVVRRLSQQIEDVNLVTDGAIAQNLSTLSKSFANKCKLWNKLAEKLGIVVGSLHEKLTDINLVITGSCVDSKLMVTSFCYGVIKTRSSDADLINADERLKDHGIAVCIFSYWR